MAFDIYKENIIENYKNPKNFGTIKNPTFTLKGNNPLCGDIIQIQLSIKNNIIQDIKFNGQGCAISIASTSLLTEYLKGKNLNKIKKLNKDFMEKLIGVKISIGRIECLLLSLKTVNEVFKNEPKRS